MLKETSGTCLNFEVYFKYFQMESHKEIDVAALSSWFENPQNFNILDIRPTSERKEWYIPGSVHVDVYEDLKERNPRLLENLEIDEGIPVVVVCNSGNLSRFAAEILGQRGFDAYSLAGGMKAWNYAFDAVTMSFDEYKIIQVRRVAKSCLSYMVGSAGKAIVFDASLDPSVYVKIAASEGWEILYVTDTHIHADYVSRTRELAKITGSVHFMNNKAQVAFPFQPLMPDEILHIGNIEIKVIFTPGHTRESTSFLIRDKVLLTGDTLFLDGIGRPDLNANEEALRKKTLDLYRSLQLISTLNSNTLILPAHHAQPIKMGQIFLADKLGSLKNTISTLSMGMDEFLGRVIENLPPPPDNYLTISEINKSGEKYDLNLSDLEAGSNRCSLRHNQ